MLYGNQLNAENSGKQLKNWKHVGRSLTWKIVMRTTSVITLVNSSQHKFVLNRAQLTLPSCADVTWMVTSWQQHDVMTSESHCADFIVNLRWPHQTIRRYKSFFILFTGLTCGKVTACTTHRSQRVKSTVTICWVASPETPWELPVWSAIKTKSLRRFKSVFFFAFHSSRGARKTNSDKIEKIATFLFLALEPLKRVAVEEINWFQPRNAIKRRFSAEIKQRRQHLIRFFVTKNISTKNVKKRTKKKIISKK